MSGPRWTVHLTESAEKDFRAILGWSLEHFGRQQARAYAATLSLAIEALASGPSAVGAKARDDIGKGIFSLHVARAGRRGRHFVVFRVARRQDLTLEVLRLLHDSMDVQRHVPTGDET